MNSIATLEPLQSIVNSILKYYPSLITDVTQPHSPRHEVGFICNIRMRPKKEPAVRGRTDASLDQAYTPRKNNWQVNQSLAID